jgi:pilus assembly protein Flp/PilA
MISFLKDEEGATAVEYSLIVALISAVIILTVVFLGQQVEECFNIIWLSG